MDNFGAQLRQVLRRFVRTPAFTLIALLTVAAGVGATTAVFSILEGVVLKPLPYPHADRLVGVWHSAPGLNLPKLNMSPTNYIVYREQGKYFEDVGLYNDDSLSITGLGQPEEIRGIDVTEGTLPILGVQPMLGRWFSKADDLPGSPATAILTYSYWKRKFGGDPNVVGKTITTDGKLRQIVGVMPADFQFLDQADLQILVPFQFNTAKFHLGNFSYEGVARLKPGATLAEANNDVARMLPIVFHSYPPPPGFSLDLFLKANITPNVHPLKDDVVGDAGKILWILMGSIALVLLIACANVANLLLVRAEGRQQELAIRSALGAGRKRIAADLMFESVLIGLVGSAIGLGLAYGALRILVAMVPEGIPRVTAIGIDWRVLLFTLAMSLFASLLFGAIPIWKYAGSHLSAGMREGGRTLSQSRERHRARNTLVVIQVGLASVLLICSGLMIRTYLALTKVNPGFSDPGGLQTLRLSIPETEIKDDEAVMRAFHTMTDKISAIPGVTSATLAYSVPMDNQHWMDPVFAQDKVYADGEIPPLRRFNFVTPGLFQTMGTPFVAGRDITWADIDQALPVVIISENFAREYWQNPQNALGKEVRTGSNDGYRQVIGVVADIHSDGMSLPAPTTIYWPAFMRNYNGDPTTVRRGLDIVIRTPRAGSQTLMKEVEQAIWSVDSNLPLTNVRTMNDLYVKSMARTSFTLTMLAIAGGMALLLGAIGLYGVIAYSVSQRTREIGIRVALGAQRNIVTGMFVRQGLILAVVGLVIGLAGAAATTRLMSSVLYKVNPVDPMTYIVVCLALVVATALASYIPSRRASAVDPMEALRTE